MGPPHLAGMPVRVCMAGVGVESTPRLEQGLAARCGGGGGGGGRSTRGSGICSRSERMSNVLFLTEAWYLQT